MAYGRLIRTVVFVAVLTFAGCSSDQAPKEENSGPKIDPVVFMADLHCTAVELRKARFELADKMRFMYDTIMLPATPEPYRQELQQRLDALEPYKDSIVGRSLDLAEVIKFKLDSIIENELEVGEERKAFDEKLTRLLKERGCE
ncbi:MAG: hypothetical protein H6601_07585 [Flavobacteriales bacterium]|nr:hypothetical protein [Flavobacteriales bacterium]